jgi:guanosine-3',5'-bis(diphosphate) 3'-pyrophosphohydrolase
VGNSCIAAKINQQHTPLSTKLKNGQTIEIITAPGAQPNPSWLNFVFTAKARTNIRIILKNLQQDESLSLGMRLLNKCLSKINMSVNDLSQNRIQQVVEDYDLKSFDELLLQIGLGNRIPQLVLRHLLPERCKELDKAQQETGHSLDIRGTEGTVVHYGRCCHPIPGDLIVGYISAGRGIVIHKQSCKNARDIRKQAHKWINVEWSEDVNTEFSVSLRVVAQHRKGVLATIASAIADSEANIEHVNTAEGEEKLYSLDFILLVKNRKHLADIMRNLRLLDMVVSITRL